MNILGVIPARYASSRLPGKPLADILGLPMVVRVYRRAAAARLLNQVLVATDDERISQACHSHDVPVILTGTHHPSGTDRIHEAAAGQDWDLVVNIQGDEPLLEPTVLDALVQPLLEPGADQAGVATLCCPLSDPAQYHDPNVVKVVRSASGKALYFSRAALPFAREQDLPQRIYKHLGLYAYTRPALDRFVALGPGYLEQTEKLEQLRFLEADIPIHVTETEHDAVSVDTAQDLERVISILRKEGRHG